MSNLNLKQISSVLHYLELIKHKEFDEYTIKSLLIDIRDSVENETLKEICHFIAHPLERDRGITHSKIDRYYFQFKYANLTDAKAPTFPVSEMTKKEFEVLCNVIINSQEDFFKNQSGISTNEAIKALESFYKNQNGKKILHKKSALNKISTILNSSMRLIESKAIITQEEIIENLKNELQKLCQDYFSKEEINELFVSQSNEIMLCILSLLQSATFKLYDSKIGVGELIINTVNDTKSAYLNGLFPIGHFNGTQAISAPLISSYIDFEKYLGEPYIKGITFEVIRDNYKNLVIKKLLPTVVLQNLGFKA